MFNPYTPPFIERVKCVMYGHPMDLSNPYDLDRMLLCNKHSQIVT